MSRKKEPLKCYGSIPNQIFGGYVYFTCGYGYDEIIKNIVADDWKLALSNDRDLLEGEYGAFALERVIEDRKADKITKYHFIILKGFNFSDYHMCTLAHECLHIVQFVLKDLLDRDREYESEAYYHTYLMEQCLEIMREAEGKNKKRKARKK